MTGRLERVIQAAFANIVDDPATPPALADLVRQIESLGHSYFSLGPGLGRSSPDASYGHLDARWPSVVIEVSYSQKGKKLKELARDYIFHSLANVRVVIGIDIGYRRTKMGVVSVWRAEKSYLPDGRLHLAARRVVTNQVSLLSLPNLLTRFMLKRHFTSLQPYRNEAGLLVPGFISLSLADFLLDSPAANAPSLDQTILISHEVLKDTVNIAESSLVATITGRWCGPPPPAGVVMESDSSGTSSPKEMTSSDERVWRAWEASAERRAEEKDSTYC